MRCSATSASSTSSQAATARSWSLGVARPDSIDQRQEAGNHAEGPPARFSSLLDPDLEGAALVEPGDDLLDVGRRRPVGKHRSGGSPDQLPGDRVAALELAFVFQLDLAGNGRQAGVDVGHPRDGRARSGAQRASFGVARDDLQQRDRQSLADARALVDPLVAARLEGDLLHQSRR